MTSGSPTDPLDAGLRLARALEIHGVPYALGGALAFGLWAIPRATIDVDVNVFVASHELRPVFDAIESLAIIVDRVSATAEAHGRGMFTVRWDRFRVDVFVASVEFAWEAARTCVVHEIEGQRASFLSAEAIAVFKLLFFRPKDIVDLQRLIAVQGSRLNHAYIRKHLVAMMGDDEERVRRWDELCSEEMGSSRGTKTPQTE